MDMRKEFKEQTLEGLNALYDYLVKCFDDELKKPYSNELYNDDGEYNLNLWLEHKLRG